jgi:hypothetical protein
MSTTLGELIQQTNRFSGGNIPSQQYVPKASIIEDVMENRSYNGGATFGEDQIIKGMKRGERNPPGIPLDYQRNNQNNFSPNLNVSMLREESRPVSFDTIIRDTPREPSTGMLKAPVYAGSVPPLKSYVSKAVPMNRIKEGYKGGQTCIDTLNHINTCPMCARYFQCDSKVYHVIIFMLIILFVTILYFVCKEEHKIR